MMRDYEYYFVRTLHTKLKPIIKGKIYVKVEEDVLYVQIMTLDGLTFEWTKDKFADIFMNNYTTQYAVYEIKESFTNFIAETVYTKYFWND